MTLDDIIPRHVVETVARVGLHKIAGAMNGIDEMTLPAAIGILGAKSYLRRKEARAIADGIASYAVLSGTKVAEDPSLVEALRRIVVPVRGA